MAQPDSVVHTAQNDPCCGLPFAKAAFAGDLDGKAEWNCPKCGCRWIPEKLGTIWNWVPNPVIAIYRP